MSLKNVIVTSLVTVVAVSCLRFFVKDQMAVQHLRNCQKIEPGMTLKQALKIMDPDGNADYKLTHASVEWDTPTFARTSTLIIFEPESEIVNEVICGDTKWSGYETLLK